MIIVHDIFICKPGNASKMAKMFKEMMSAQGRSASGGKNYHDMFLTGSREIYRVV